MAPLHSRNDSRAQDQQRWLDPQRCFDLSQDLMCITDAQGRFLRVNASARRILGYAPEELIGRKLIDLVHPADVQRTLLAQDSVLRGAPVVEFANSCVRSDGTAVDLSWTASWVTDADNAGVSYAVARDITHRKRAEVLGEAQREVLQMIATGGALPEILRRICVILETFDPEAKCAVTLFDAPARGAGAGISPSLPSRFLTIVQDTLLGGAATSHWAATLRSGQTAICADMEVDPEWHGLGELAAEHALRAGWMTPVFGADGNLIATIGVFYSHPYEPSRRELLLVQTAASLVAVAIEHASAHQRLSSLGEAARKMNSSHSIEALLQVTADTARDLVGAHAAFSVSNGTDAGGLENARRDTELDARVRQRTQQLQDSNRELEAFGYSVSHDLRGPLRAIAGFTGLLRDHHYETIDADGRRYIDRVLAGTQRMSKLIDDLLELGRVTRVEIRRRRVDLSEYAKAILARLREAAPERAAAIVIEPRVWVEGDPGLLEIALENLLDNAWKFTAGRPVAEIRFGVCRDTGREPGRNDGERTVFVQDNGVGFDPRYSANLFGVFQRLHAGGEFPGTGVGLATVRRIVQRHGGRVWAEAGVDRGATIYFTMGQQ